MVPLFQGHMETPEPGTTQTLFVITAAPRDPERGVTAWSGVLRIASGDTCPVCTVPGREQQSLRSTGPVPSSLPPPGRAWPTLAETQKGRALGRPAAATSPPLGRQCLKVTSVRLATSGGPRT